MAVLAPTLVPALVLATHSNSASSSMGCSVARSEHSAFFDLMPSCLRRFISARRIWLERRELEVSMGCRLVRCSVVPCGVRSSTSLKLKAHPNLPS